jgi:hypothetical protein
VERNERVSKTGGLFQIIFWRADVLGGVSSLCNIEDGKKIAVLF